MIEARSIYYAIGSRKILDNLSLQAPTGKITALVGASGSGKSTALSVLGLLLRPQSGQVLIDGAMASSFSEKQRRRFWAEKAAFIYQDSGVIDERSVAYNVILRRFSKKSEEFSRVLESLEQVGLRGREEDPASVLSGGEKQRLGIARALFKEATWIFADEPTASLDSRNRDEMINLFTGLADRGCGVIVATHDEAMIRAANSTVSLDQPSL